MTRKRLTAAIAAALAVLIAAGVTLLVRNTVLKPTTITAYFASATAIYPGDEVRVSGVKVGTVKTIEPQGTKAKMTLAVKSNYDPAQKTPVNITFKSPTTTVSVPAVVDIKGKMLTLSAPLTAQMIMSPGLGKMLASANPYLEDGVTSPDPVDLRLDDKTFRVPMSNTQVQDVTIAGTVKLGPVTLGPGKRSGGLLDFLSKLASLSGGGGSSDTKGATPNSGGASTGNSGGTSGGGGGVTAVSTPLNFVLDKGVLSYKDFVMTLSMGAVLDFGGQVDLVSRQLKLLMKAGLPGLKGLAGGGDFQVPVAVGGTIEEPKPDYGAALKELAGQVAKGAAESALKKGAGGALPGGGGGAPAAPGLPSAPGSPGLPGLP